MEKQGKNPRPSHETHTGALIFLSLATLVVVGVAYSSTRMPTSDGQEQAKQAAIINTDAGRQSAAAGLPAGAEPVSGLSGFPTGLPLATSTMVANYRLPIPGQTERVLRYDTASSTTEVRASYLSWLAENDFEVVKEKSASLAASLAALNRQNRDLIVLISNPGGQPGGATRVELVTHHAR